MRLRVETFCRAFALVACTAANVKQITLNHYGGAFLLGTAISWLWFRNARGAALDGETYLRECYALGAGCGTVFGVAMMGWFYGR
jgi:hypothetical protein